MAEGHAIRKKMCIRDSIKAKCSHMGCGLKWNDAEKTWDCPCHGSRYDIHGNVLEAPAIRGIGEE